MNSSISILLPALSAYDAIGNDVLAEYELLKKSGLDVNIFAEYYEPQFSRLIADKKRILETDALLYHHGVRWDFGESLLKNSSAPIKIMKYHNVTPSEFFSDYSPYLFELVEEGRQQTNRLAQSCTHFLADSVYNCEELLELGIPASKCKVVAPFAQVEELLSLQADLVSLEKRIRANRIHVLFVGRQAPNKGLHHFIRVADAFSRLFGKKACFTWIGGRDTTLVRYYQEIEDYLHEKSLQDIVLFPGKIPASHLKAYYLSSNVFLSVSEHEGFCVPIIEAQALGVPVIALGRTAVTGTIGEGQLVLEDLDYDKFAAAIAVLFNNPYYNNYVSTHGKKNYLEHFSKEVLQENFLKTLEEVLMA
jgi:glycosyltransferase involved in cell wall biosynthesis